MKEFFKENWQSVLTLLIIGGAGIADVIIYKKYLKDLNELQGITEDIDKS